MLHYCPYHTILVLELYRRRVCLVLESQDPWRPALWEVPVVPG